MPTLQEVANYLDDLSFEKIRVVTVPYKPLASEDDVVFVAAFCNVILVAFGLEHGTVMFDKDNKGTWKEIIEKACGLEGSLSESDVE